MCGSNGALRYTPRLTLNDGQQDYDDKEEKCDVKDHTLHLKLISSGVLDLIADAPAGTHANVHVEHVALKQDISLIRFDLQEKSTILHIQAEQLQQRDLALTGVKTEKMERI